MSKKNKKLKREIEYQKSLDLMDDIFNGTVDYSTEKAFEDDEDELDGFKEIFNCIISDSNDNTNDISEETLPHEILFGNIINDSVDPEEDNCREAVKARTFYEFSAVMTEYLGNIIKISDGIKNITVDIHTLDEDHYDIAFETDNDYNEYIKNRVNTFINTVITRFNPSAIYSTFTINNRLKGLYQYSERNYKFVREDNIVMGYYISDSVLEELEDIFKTLLNTNILDSFINYIYSVTELPGFNFNNIDSDYLKVLMTRKDYTDSSIEFLNVLIEDDESVFNYSFDNIAIYDHLIDTENDDVLNTTSEEIEEDVVNESEELTDDIQLDTPEEVKPKEWDFVPMTSDESEEEDDESEEIEESDDFDDLDEEDEITFDETSDTNSETSEELIGDIELDSSEEDVEDINDTSSIIEETDDNVEENENEEEIFDPDDISPEYESYMKKNRPNNSKYNKHKSNKNKNNDDDWKVPQHRSNK